MPPPGGVAATLKERRGPRDFLVHDPGRALRGRRSCTGSGPKRQLCFPPRGWIAAGSPRGRRGAHRPAPVVPRPPRPETRASRPRPDDGRRVQQRGRPPRGHRGAALTDLVRHPRPLVTAPRSARPSGPPAPQIRRAETESGTGTERRRRACRARRGRSEAGAPRSARALPCALPLRTHRTRKRGPARGSPPALTIYSQALSSALRPWRACADLASPLPPRGSRPDAPPPEVASPRGPVKGRRGRRLACERSQERMGEGHIRAAGWKRRGLRPRALSEVCGAQKASARCGGGSGEAFFLPEFA